MSEMNLQGSGVALITPMKDNGAVDYAAYEALLDWHLAAGTAMLVVLGTTGESVTLTGQEREKLISLTVKRAAGRLPVIAGCGTNSTAGSIELVKQTADLGVDVGLVVTPYYNKPSQEGLYQHYTVIAEAVDLPLMLYNVPGRTCCDLLAETAVRLSVHPNIVAIKDATADISRVAPLKASGLAVLSGDDASALDFFKAGGDGVVSVIANVLPELWAQMCDAALAKDFATADKINAALAQLNQALYLESNPIPLKWLLYKLGKIEQGIRLPLTPLAEQYQEQLLTSYNKLSQEI